MQAYSRRQVLASSAAASAAYGLASALSQRAQAASDSPAIPYGLVTYMWGADWDLPTLLANCKKTNVL
ncbi:MAG TPA: sugar phosphate isomerase/epimerase, partial [Pirellulaceae bacterium]|nr:sugar phosphate isomerase/epimerase [Pirellulaceae bacterium]